ncbi:T9SS type A sorting domain-containing protein [Fluviicola sp.]|uniref:Ig-like domain-containing protein n=1 Tax=Fluviicola sp. TaxID=1917219 RepID=UPI003D28ECA9
MNFSRFILCFALLILGSGSLFGQVSGTKTIPTDYATIAAFITDINTNGIGSGGVTLNVPSGYTETAPAGGFTITATGTVANPIIIQKSGAGANPVLTAFTGGTGTPGTAVQDGILSLVGSDYVTIDGIDLTENASNTSNPATMEYGLGLFKASATDGCQNNLIRNCTITLSTVNNASGTSPAFDGSRGINVVNSLITTQTTAVTVTSAAGSNSNNQFYTNIIRNTNIGIALSGFAAASPFTLGDTGNDVGGIAGATGNTIVNFGGAASASNPSAGIRTLNQWGLNVSYNTLNNNSGTGANHVSTLRGIFIGAATSASATVNNNNITVVSGATTSLLEGIDNASGSTAASNTINLNNNIVQIAYSTATSATINGILNGGSATTVNINGNTITNVGTLPIAQNVLGGTGTLVMIEGGSPTNLNMMNNTVTALGRTGVSGSWRIIKMTSPTTTVVSGNTVENLAYVTPISTGGIDGIYGFTSSIDVTITNNIVRNLTTPTTGTLNGIREFGVAGNKIVTGNQVYGFATASGGAGGATFNGIHLSVGTLTVQNNTIYNLVSTGSSGGTGGVINGIQIGTGTIPTATVRENKIYDLSSTSTGVVVSGVNMALGATLTTGNIQNNLIGDLRAPAVSGTNAIMGINVSAGTTVNVYYNTVHLAASSTGTNFGTSAIFAATAPTLNLNNNIFSNASTANGTGLAAAYRRSTTTLTSYGAGSNRNDFVGSTIFTDGTNTDATFAAYQTRVSARDVNSINAAPNFLSTVGSNVNFLHINTALPTAIESGGANIGGITIDYDNQTRQGNGGYVGTGTAPDMGADEFELAVVNCSSASGGTISPASASICTGATKVMTATGATNENGISYQWKVATVSGGPYSNVVGGSGATASTYTTAPMTTGTYYFILEATCSFGPVSGTSNEFALVVNPAPTISITPGSAAYCTPGPGVTLTGNGGVTYGWSPTAGLSAATGTSVTATPTVTTTYTVLGVDGNGCQNTAQTTITVAPIPVISSVTATPAAVCFGNNSQLQANATVSTLARNYSFSTSTGAVLDPMVGSTQVINASNDDTPTAASAPIGFTFNFNGVNYTNYSVSPDGWILLGNGAAASEFTNSATSTANTPKIYPFWDDLATGTDGNVKVLVSGTAPNRIFIVQWFVTVPRNTTGAANSTFQTWLYESTNAIEFRYGAMGTPSSGTISSGLTASATNFNSTSFSTNTSSGSTANDINAIAPASGRMYIYTPAAQPSYSWTPAGDLSNPSIANPIANNITAPVSYTVTATSGSCSASGNVSLTVNPLPSAPTSTNSAQCGAQIPTASVASTTVASTPTFRWYDAATAGNLMQSSTSTTYTSVVPSTTIFYVSEVDGVTGCESNRTPVTVTVAAADGISASVDNATICIGSSIVLTAANTNPTPLQSYTYTWAGTAGSGITSQNGTPITVTPTIPGTYTYNLTGVDGGCNAVASVNVTVNPFAVVLSPVNVTCNGYNNGTFTQGAVTCGTAPYTYSIDGGAFVGTIPTNLTPGTHAVVVMNSLGFTSASQNITITEPATTISNPTGSGATVCQNTLSAIVSGASTTNVIGAPVTVVIPFNIASQPTELSANTVPTVAASPNVISTAVMAALPAGSVITSATLNYDGIQATGSSWMSDVRLGLTGAVAQPYTTGTGSTNAAGTFNYTVPVTPASVNVAGGSVSLHYFDFFNDNTSGSEATFPTGAGVANLTIVYTPPVSATISWWNASTGGTQIGTGSPFETVGTSVLPNTNTPGIYTVYAQGEYNSCSGVTRTPVTVTVKAISTSTSSATACATYTWNGTTYTTSGTYTHTLVNSVGCDSIATLNLTINSPSASSVSVAACDTYTWAQNGMTYVTSGAYRDTILNAVGCDSVITLNLTINHPTTATVNQVACQTYTWPINSTTYTTSGTHTATILNAAGCDSVITLNLTIGAPSASLVAQTACVSYTWPQTGLTYTVSGAYNDTVPNMFGCDSVITLSLTINQPTSSLVVESECASFTWAQNGMTYTTSGIYTDTIPNAAGCDSVITLNLTIVQPTSSSVSATACTSYTWAQNGMTYTASGAYTDTIPNMAGCDSIITLNLTINQPTTASVTVSTCNPSYTWAQNGMTYTASGMYNDTITNAAGCDSVVTLNLTIAPFVATATDNGNATATASAGTTYQWINCTTNSPIAGATAQTFVATANGTYAAIVSNGTCSDTTNCVTIANVGIKESMISTISVHPNPTHDVVVVTMEAASATVEVMDVQGKLIQTTQIKSGDQIDLSTYERGVYTLRIKTEFGTSLERIVKN